MQKTLVAMAALALAVPAFAQSGSNDPNSGTHSGSGSQSGQSGTTSSTGSSSDERTGSAGTAQAQGAALGQDDREFLRKAAAGGMAEVELGRLATKQAQSEDVKKFGQRMVDDHSRANDELKTIALKLGIQVPKATDPEHKQKREKLAKLNGAEFDREYIKLMAQDHEKDIKLFQRESENGKSSELKAFASKTLPILQEHQQMVTQLQGGTGGTMGTGSTTGSGDTGTSGGTSSSSGTSTSGTSSSGSSSSGSSPSGSGSSGSGGTEPRTK